MSDRTHPISFRLTEPEIEQLQARAYALSATASGIARDLVRTGLAGGDLKELADRLMQVERRLAAIDQQNQDIIRSANTVEQGVRDLLTMFRALLDALSKSEPGRPQ